MKVKGFKNFVAEPGSFGKFPVIQQGDNPLAGWSDNEPIADANKYVLFGDHTLSLYKPNSPFLVTSDGIKIFFANGLDRDFFYYLLQRYKPNSEGYKRHYSILKKTSCYLPKNLLEQKQIGVFFDAIDLVITLHQKKLCYKRLKCKINLTMFALETHFYHVDFNLVSKGSRLNIMQCVD